MLDLKKVGARIASFRMARGMTQEDLQEIVNNNTFQAPTRISAATTF